jgi:hypothetical protein
MLAGAQAVDTVIGAAAGIQRLVERSYLHVIAAARCGPHPERAEMPLGRVERLGADDFGAATPAPPLDFFLVAGTPAQHRRRTLDHTSGEPPFGMGAAPRFGGVERLCAGWLLHGSPRRLEVLFGALLHHRPRVAAAGPGVGAAATASLRR